MTTLAQPLQQQQQMQTFGETQVENAIKLHVPMQFSKQFLREVDPSLTCSWDVAALMAGIINDLAYDILQMGFLAAKAPNEKIESQDILRGLILDASLYLRCVDKNPKALRLLQVRKDQDSKKTTKKGKSSASKHSSTSTSLSTLSLSSTESKSRRQAPARPSKIQAEQAMKEETHMDEDSEADDEDYHQTQSEAESSTDESNDQGEEDDEEDEEDGNLEGFVEN